MTKVFFTSDLHFNHKKIIEYENRPFNSVEEMNLKMIENWNKVVSDKDEIYILGDFCFGKHEEVYQIAKRLNGRKYIILGNHDKSIKTMPQSMKEDIFEWVKDYHFLKYQGMKVALFHYPIQTWDCQQHGALHFHGHIHSNISNHRMEHYIPNSYNVGVDVNNYTPIEFNEILGRL